MAKRSKHWPPRILALIIAGAMLTLAAPASSSWAAYSTLIDSGDPANRVDIVFLGDGYTQANLSAGLYASHVQNYLDYMFAAPDYLADPFPRYRNFFNVHLVDVVSQESGADDPVPNGIFRNTALGATYDTSGIDRLLSINANSANAFLQANLSGTGLTADIRMVTVNDTQYGGSGGQWAVFAGGNVDARDIALHELSHSFSKTADEYASLPGVFPSAEPSAVNVTKNPLGQKWSHWLGFQDPRADYLEVGVFEGAAFYSQGIYRPTLDSKLRTLDRPFNAVVREKTILDIYQHVDPLDDWRDNGTTIEGGALWVDVVDPDVVMVDWYVNDQLIGIERGESFDLADFDFSAGTYQVRAHAYDEAVRHAFDGQLLDLVRTNLEELQQDVVWNVNYIPPLPGDYNRDTVVDANDFAVLEVELWLDQRIGSRWQPQRDCRRGRLHRVAG